MRGILIVVGGVIASIIIITVILYVACSRETRRDIERMITGLFVWMFQGATIYKQMKKKSKPTDTFMFWTSAMGIVLLIIFIGGLFSHFTHLDYTKKACNMIVGVQWWPKENQCSYDYNYYMPDGLRALDKINPSRLGIDMTCNCGDSQEHIQVEGEFRRWLK